MKFFPALSPAVKTWLGHAARIAVGVIVVYFLIRTGALKPQLLGRAITRHPGHYGLAFLLYAVVLEGLAYFRWLWLLRAARVAISSGEVLRLHLMGLFFSGFLPGGTGGDLVRGYYLLKGRNKVEGAAALGTLVLDRVVGLFGLFALAALFNLINADIWHASHVLAVQAVFILTVAFVMLLLSLAYLSPWKPRWLPDAVPKDDKGGKRGFAVELFAALASFRRAPRAFVGTIALSMMVHFCLVLVYALCAGALDVSLPLRLHAYVGPTLTLVNGIPVSPAGLGMGEAAGKVLYTAVGATHGQAEIPALVHTIGLLTALLCAPAYFLRGRKKSA